MFIKLRFGNWEWSAKERHSLFILQEEN